MIPAVGMVLILLACFVHRIFDNNGAAVGAQATQIGSHANIKFFNDVDGDFYSRFPAPHIASAVVNLSDQSILSLDDHERWVSPTGIAFFMEWTASNGSSNQTLSPDGAFYNDLGEVPMGHLKSYRECVSFKIGLRKFLH